MKNKRSKEEYEIAAKQSFSIADVCRKLDIKPVGGNYKTVKDNLEKFNIDTSHFTGQGWNVGLKFRPRKQLELKDILKENSPYQSLKLKNRLLQEGLKEYKCERCGLTEWQKKPIPLELHHINGNHNDNRLENLQILCPNCHALTDNFRGKNNIRYNKKKDLVLNGLVTKKSEKTNKKEKQKRYCLYCGHELNRKQTKYCSKECMHNAVSKRPSVFELIDKIKEYNGNNCELGRFYGVSEQAIRKWLKLYKLYRNGSVVER